MVMNLKKIIKYTKYFSAGFLAFLLYSFSFDSGDKYSSLIEGNKYDNYFSRIKINSAYGDGSGGGGGTYTGESGGTGGCGTDYTGNNINGGSGDGCGDSGGGGDDCGF